MIIQYFEPLSKAFRRMSNALFHPFDIGKWFAVGFTAFLAGLVDGPYGNSFTKFDTKDFSRAIDDFLDFPNIAWEWLVNHPGWFTIIAVGIIILVAFILVITWLSSRGTFMFLHNVVYDKKEISTPWYKYSKEANSLFLWRLGFGAVLFAVFLGSFYLFYNILLNIQAEYFNWNSSIPFLIMMGLGFLVTLIITAYISMLVDNFVVLIMFKNRVNIIEGWRQFSSVLFSKFIYFLLYGLLLFLFYILIVIGVILISIFTCCLGFIILVIPYINSVFLLPISYTLRAYSIDFFEQFGSTYKIYPIIETLDSENN